MNTVSHGLIAAALLSSVAWPLATSSGPSDATVPTKISLAAPSRWSHREILDAIRMVESGGREDCSDGDGGRSIGVFQITREYWRDATAFDPALRGTYQDCRDRTYAQKVIRAYMLRYVPEAWHSANAEVIARTHNGGPKGAEKSSTWKFWVKVKRELIKKSRKSLTSLRNHHPMR